MLAYLISTPYGYLHSEALFADWTYTTDPLKAYTFGSADEAHTLGTRAVRDHFEIVRQLDGTLETIARIRVYSSVADAVASLGRIEFERVASAALLEGMRVTPDVADVPPLRTMVTDPAWTPFLLDQLAQHRVEVAG